MDFDIKKLLNSWKYIPEDNIRVIKTDDGREILQVRLPMGIEQYELSGRPDSARPFGKESLLEEYQKRLEDAVRTGIKFSLTKEDFHSLHNEALMYYYRYLILFQTADYQRTIADTFHNLEICDLIEKYYPGRNKIELLQYKPYILRINAIAKAMILIKDKKENDAIELIEDTIKKINNLAAINSEIFAIEKKRSLKHLDEIIKQLKNHFPDEKEILETELKKAVELEDFKQAALIRDKINKLK
jgi:hypothetical protein